MLTCDKKYKLLANSCDYLVIENDNREVSLIDTGFNGHSERIEDADSIGSGLGLKYSYAVWIGSYCFVEVGTIMIIDYKNRTLVFTNQLPNVNDFHCIPFSDSSSCDGVSSLLGCGLGPIVAIPTLISQRDKTFKANAFVDTGSPHSMILRSRMKANGMDALEFGQCEFGDSVIPVHIDTQNILYKQRNNIDIKFITNTSEIVDTKAEGMLIACGKQDPLPSQSYNDKLGKVDLSPFVDATLGNDGLCSHDCIIFDYGNRKLYVKKATAVAQRALVRQNVRLSTNDMLMLFLMLALYVLRNKKRERRIVLVLLMSMIFLR